MTIKIAETIKNRRQIGIKGGVSCHCIWLLIYEKNQQGTISHLDEISPECR